MLCCFPHIKQCVVVRFWTAEVPLMHSNLILVRCWSDSHFGIQMPTWVIIWNSTHFAFLLLRLLSTSLVYLWNLLSSCTFSVKVFNYSSALSCHQNPFPPRFLLAQSFVTIEHWQLHILPPNFSQRSLNGLISYPKLKVISWTHNSITHAATRSVSLMLSNQKSVKIAFNFTCQLSIMFCCIHPCCFKISLQFWIDWSA